jgi:hypothetical protein
MKRNEMGAIGLLMDRFANSSKSAATLYISKTTCMICSRNQLEILVNSNRKMDAQDETIGATKPTNTSASGNKYGMECS